MAPKNSKAAKTTQSKAPEPAVPKEYPTISALLEDQYNASRPYLHLAETKGLSSLSPAEKQSYALSRFLEAGTYKTFPAATQKEFWKAIEERKIPFPLKKPGDLGKDRRGREVGSYTPEEYRAWVKREEELSVLRGKSRAFGREFKKRKENKRSILKEEDIGEEREVRDEEWEGKIQEERNRRKLIRNLEGGVKKMGGYEGDPEWDDVIPIPQDEGEGALAAIAYTDEYAEAISYLRAIIASNEHSPRVLNLTSHIISLNPAHYTVWLYRAQTLFALSTPETILTSIRSELEWVNSIALSHQKNYQIWHHRQLLIDHIYPSVSSSPEALSELESSEREFMTEMFDEDAKNYHVWSYRQYLVRKLNLFSSPKELASIETLIKTDVRNNSAWSHRFFLVFSNPEYTTPDSKATEHDPVIPDNVIDRELAFAQAATYEAPQNQSSWNYIRGVLRKAGRPASSLEGFASEFVRLPGLAKKNGEGEEEEEEDVKSSHALDFLADVWSEDGKIDEADRALRLLGDRYDRVRRNYWEWRRGQLKGGKREEGKGVEGLSEGVGGLAVKEE